MSQLFARPPTCRLNWKWFTVAAILSLSRCAWTTTTGQSLSPIWLCRRVWVAGAPVEPCCVRGRKDCLNARRHSRIITAQGESRTRSAWLSWSWSLRAKPAPRTVGAAEDPASAHRLYSACIVGQECVFWNTRRLLLVSMSSS
jgi:hypothetical protein